MSEKASLDNLETFLEAVRRGEDQRAEACIPGLVRDGETALEALKPLLSHANSDARWWAVRVLAEIPTGDIAPLLISALEDEDVTVRQCAALALYRRPDPGAFPHLLAALNQPNRLLARLAGNALVALGASAVPPLLEVMRKGPQTARLEAARALALIGDSRAVPVLFEALDDVSAYVGFWAEEGLERMGVGMVFFKP